MSDQFLAGGNEFSDWQRESKRVMLDSLIYINNCIKISRNKNWTTKEVRWIQYHCEFWRYRRPKASGIAEMNSKLFSDI